LDLTNQMSLSKLTISSGILSPDFAPAIDKVGQLTLVDPG
jgi:hypothetical protein